MNMEEAIFKAVCDIIAVRLHRDGYADERAKAREIIDAVIAWRAMDGCRGCAEHMARRPTPGQTQREGA